MRTLVIVWLLLLSGVIAAEERGGVILPGAAIKGIEANPRVTFIVPWQRSSMRTFPLLPAHSALDELYTPISSRQLELDVELGGVSIPLQH